MANLVPDSASIRGWLLIQPRPAKVRVTTVEGDERTLSTGNGITWAALAQSIEACSPTKLEGLDDDGQLLRAVRADSLAVEAGEQSSVAASLARTAAVDGESVRFDKFAGHIADAYKFATEIAFSKLVDIVTAQNKRADALEKSLATTERMLRKAYDDNLKLQIAIASAKDGDNGDLLGEMVKAFFGSSRGDDDEKTTSDLSNPPKPE